MRKRVHHKLQQNHCYPFGEEMLIIGIVHKIGGLYIAIKIK